jgi:hypothetical protein
MRKNNCEVIRRELDELALDQTWSSSAAEHLQACSACRQFQQKQNKLRQIVGSLGTVEAPPDFDFRLRARLANDSSSTAFHLSSAYWPFARRGLAVAAMVLLIATGAVLVRNVIDRQQAPVEITNNNPPVVSQPSTVPASTTSPTAPVKPEEFSAVIPPRAPQKVKSERSSQSVPRSKRQIGSLDFSSERAPVITGSEPVETSGAVAVFPIDASMQSLKVSLDDGQGNARIISVPTITFGSQRSLQSGNQFAPKGIW